MTKYWLLKSEAETFSIDDLKKVKAEPWTGVRNYQARNFIRDQMKTGDLCLFYHSNAKEIGIVGICKIVSEPYLDPTFTNDKNPWFCMDVEFVQKFKKILTLNEMKVNPKLKDMLVTRKGNRLSVQPVLEKDFQYIVGLEVGL
jgi:predicted RNA-binding protein with PUA-like domain